MAKTTVTTSTASIVGILGLSLLRDGRSMENGELETRLATINNVLNADATENQKRLVRHMPHTEGYDLFADTYDDGPNPLISVEERALAKLLEASPPTQALDAACGTGRLSALLAGMGYDVVGVDQSGAMLAKARIKVPGASFRTGRLEALPFDGAAGFGLAVCGLAMTHCKDLRAPIGELARVVRPGGRILISDIHPFAVLLGAHVNFPTAGNEIALIRNLHHTHGDYLRAIHAAGLQVNDCIEPVISDAEIEMIVGGRGSSELQMEIEAISRKALAGLPFGLIWDLQKPV